MQDIGPGSTNPAAPTIIGAGEYSVTPGYVLADDFSNQLNWRFTMPVDGVVRIDMLLSNVDGNPANNTPNHPYVQWASYSVVGSLAAYEVIQHDTTASGVSDITLKLAAGTVMDITGLGVAGLDPDTFEIDHTPMNVALRVSQVLPAVYHREVKSGTSGFEHGTPDAKIQTGDEDAFDHAFTGDDPDRGIAWTDEISHSGSQAAKLYTAGGDTGSGAYSAGPDGGGYDDPAWADLQHLWKRAEWSSYVYQKNWHGIFASYEISGWTASAGAGQFYFRGPEVADPDTERLWFVRSQPAGIGEDGYPTSPWIDHWTDTGIDFNNRWLKTRFVSDVAAGTCQAWIYDEDGTQLWTSGPFDGLFYVLPTTPYTQVGNAVLSLVGFDDGAGSDVPGYVDDVFFRWEWDAFDDPALEDPDAGVIDGQLDETRARIYRRRA